MTAGGGNATLGVPNASVDKLYNTPFTRTLPIKRYDAEPLTRSDLQHNLLSHIFNDQTRCFTNPRPLELASKVQNYQPALVYPYGHSYNCSRRSDETLAEYQKWKSDYDDWNRKQSKDTGHDADADGAAVEKQQQQQSSNSNDPTPGCKYLTFKELYMEAIINSQRCTKNMRDKLIADPEYAEDFAKVCLLVNVGKMNTTLAFYPEMKTILRSYHPLPSLQRNENTRKVMQDAPRMKSILKSAFLIHEEPPAVSSRVTAKSEAGAGGPSNDKTAKNRKATIKNAEENNITLEDVPNNLDEIFEKFNKKSSTRDPVTSICTLLFILSSCPEEITALHYDNEKKSKKVKGIVQGGEGEDEFLVDDDQGLSKNEIEKEQEDFLSIFYPRKDSYLSSKSRAQSFLWLIWNYYEGFNRLPFLSSDLIQSNPFNDEHSRSSEKRVQEYFTSLNQDQKEDLIQKSNGRWKGIESQEGLNWLKGSLPSSSSNAAANKLKSAATLAKENQASKLKTVPALINLIEKDGSPSILYDTCPKSKAGHPPPSLFKKRLLAPRFVKIPKDQWERENVDTEEESRWGKEMKEERGQFLIEFAGNEQRKALGEVTGAGSSSSSAYPSVLAEDREKRENSIQSTRSGGGGGMGGLGEDDEEDELMSESGTPAPIGGGSSIKNSESSSGKGKRKASEVENGGGGGQERKIMKRLPQGNSAYPLANILAQANKNAQSMANLNSSEMSASTSVKMEISQSGGSRDGGASGGETFRDHLDEIVPGKQYSTSHQSKIRTLKNLWNLDLNYPKTLEMETDQPSSSSTRSALKNLIHFDSDSNSRSDSQPLLPSLPTKAWSRILNRASKGVGDASYESDDETVLVEDAADELPRGELSRILRVLRCLRGVELAKEDEGEVQDSKQNIKMEMD